MMKTNTAAFTFTTVDIDPLEHQQETNGISFPENVVHSSRTVPETCRLYNELFVVAHHLTKTLCHYVYHPSALYVTTMEWSAKVCVSFGQNDADKDV